MSMIGEYARLTNTELEQAIADPEWAWNLVEERAESGVDDAEPSEALVFDVEKAWHAIAFLLGRAEFPVDIVYGETPLAGADDWGYGPPRYLPPDRVLTAAEALATLASDELFENARLGELQAADIYPQIWDDRESVDYVRGHFERLESFVRAAADRGDALMLWIG